MTIKAGQSQSGFTLIELALVLIVAGLVTTTVMTMFGIYNKMATMSKTKDALKNSNSALLEYVANFGVYPCPADPSLGPGDINYGREQRVIGVNYLDPNYDTVACVFPGASVPGADTADPGTAPDGVLIGAVPVVTIVERLLASGTMYAKFSDYYSTDGWNRKLRYAVTESLTNRNTYNNFLGAIQIVDENNTSLLDENEDENLNGILDPGEDRNGNGVLDFGQYAHFVLISHGENGVGAFMRDGTLVESCVSTVPMPGPAPPGTSAVNELQNCDDAEGIFLSGLRNESQLSYNDDIVKFTFYENSSLWRYVAQGAIENTNIGNVGIGTNTPQEMLHVADELNVVIGTRARGYTDRTGSNFVPAETIGGNATTPASTAMQCPAGQVVTRIERDPGTQLPRVTCGAPYGAAAPPNMTCPVVSGTQYVMYGLRNVSGGGIALLCCDPTASSGPDVCP